MPPQDTKLSQDAEAQRLARDKSSQHRQHPQPTTAKKAKKRQRVRSPLARFTIALLRLAGFGYAAILVALVLMEDRMIYPGAFFSDEIAANSAADSAVETVSYLSTGGITLHGRLLNREEGRHIVLYLHGNAEKAKWLDDWIGQLSEQFDATVMIAEYRGYEDDVAPTEKGILDDCFAARDYLCERYQETPEDIVLYGRSLGGGCAVALASRGGAKVLVLDRTFDRLVNVATAQYPFVPVRLLMRNRYDSIAKLTVYKGPLIQIHGSNDTILPIENARRLFESAACQPREFIEIPGLGHNDPLPPRALQEIFERVDEFSVKR